MGMNTIDNFINMCNDMSIADESFATMKLTYQNFEMESQKFTTQITMEQDLKKLIKIYQSYYERIAEFQAQINNDTFSKKDKVINIAQVVGTVILAIPTLGIGLVGLSARRGAYKKAKTTKLGDLLQVTAETINKYKYFVSKGYKTMDSLKDVAIEKDERTGSYQLYEKVHDKDIVVIRIDGEDHAYRRLPDDEYTVMVSDDIDSDDTKYDVFRIIK